MSDLSERPWSESPYAPKIPYEVYLGEKGSFAGVLIGAILYGIIIVLFFQCIGALLNPINCARRDVKWGHVVHTVAMFTFVTVYTGMTIDIHSSCYIDSREFPGVVGMLPPGPLGYRFFIYTKAISIVPNAMFLLNNWLADGLLLYRCYVIYSMNHWVVAFPFLVYLASMATGVLLIYQTSEPSNIWNSFDMRLGIPYFSISVALNVLLTLMIVARIVLHNRNLRDAMGLPRTGGLYKAVVTILIESSALYAINSLLFIGTWGARNRVAGVFLPILAETQVIAPLLIILRVANRRALTGNTLVSGAASSFRVGSRGKFSSGGWSVPRGYQMNSIDAYRNAPSKLGVEVETTVDFRCDAV